jgi:hypothetical protein
VPGEGPCDRVLAFGGAGPGEPLAELVDWQGLAGTPASEAVAFESEAVTSVVAPVFCGTTLVGGVTAEGAPIMGRLDLDLSRLPEGPLVWQAVTDDVMGFDVPAWAGHAIDGCGLAFGGLAADGSASAAAFSADGPQAGGLEVTRIGPAAGRVGAGPLAGAWVVLGGATPDEGGAELRPLPGAEIWLP